MIRLLSIFLSVQLVFLPTLAYAENVAPKAQLLKKGQRAPYEGLLLSKEAQAKMIAEKEEAKRLCKLEIQYLTMRGNQDCKYKVDLHKIEIDSLEKKHKTIIKLKDEEIGRLQEIAVKNPNSNAKWWLTGGVVVGILVSIATFFAVAEISKAAK